MARIDYKYIYDRQRKKWEALTDDEAGGKYDLLVAGHYSENNHFIYELLQNAEDEGASRIVFDYYSDRLRVFHNGEPFDQKDVEGICTFIDGTKDKDSVQKIGHFGLGFKSVFKYTNNPEVYSDDEAFRIVRYLLPVGIETNGFPQNSFITLGDQKISVFSANEHSTMFVLPYKSEILSKKAAVMANDILDKLINLEPEVLLFLENITELVWIDNTTGRHGYIRKEIVDRIDPSEFYNISIVSCNSFDSIRANTSIKSKSLAKANETSITYVLLSRKFSVNIGMQHNANISIAYKLNISKTGIVPIEDATIWVFFPTRDYSGLPFLVHGTYETPVSREKIMYPSEYNKALFIKTEYLIIDSLSFLKTKNLLTQNFIKQIILPSLENKYLKNLHELINTTFKKKELLPVTKDKYSSVESAMVAVPFDLPLFISSEATISTPYEKYEFVELSDVNNSANYIKWLLDELNCKSFTLFDFAILLSKKPLERFGEYVKLLKYLSKSLSYYDYRNSRYDEVFSEGREKAIPILQQSPIILTKAATFSSSKNATGKTSLYFKSKNDYQVISPEHAVAEILEADEYICEMLRKHFGITKFDNKVFVTETILPKYINLDIHIEDAAHVSDIKAILSVIKEWRMDHSEIVEFLKDTYLLKAKSTKDGKIYFLKGQPYFAITKDGIDIKSYFENIINIYIVEEEFYRANAISYDDLLTLGVRDNILTGEIYTWGEYPSRHPGKKPEWHTYGDFRWYLSIESVIEVLMYISAHPNSTSSKQKSATILKLLQKNEMKLLGTVRIGGSRLPNIDNACSEIVSIVRDRKTRNYLHTDTLRKWDGKWLYTLTGDLVSSGSISKYDLDINLYGKVSLDSKLYNLLGFAEGSTDKAEATFREYSTMPKDKRESFFQTAWDHGELKDWLLQNDYISGEPFSDASSDEEFSFPSIPVKNIELLQKHVRESIFCANPVKYEKVLRSIRISKNINSSREYLWSMYGITNNKCICQMCQGIGSFEAVQIERTTTLELDQINLCLCPTCAEKYRQLRSDDIFIDSFFESIIDSDPFSDDPIEISCCNMEIYFTQTHLAEVQEILKFQSDAT